MKKLTALLLLTLMFLTACAKPAPTLELPSEEPLIEEVIASAEESSAEPSSTPSEAPASSAASTTSKAAASKATAPASQATQQSTTPSVTIPANIASDSMSKEEYTAALAVAEQIVAPLRGKSKVEINDGIAYALAHNYQPKNKNTKSANWNNPYGYLIENNGNCVGIAKAVGLCLNLCGISWNHINKGKDSHQWVENFDGEYNVVIDPAQGDESRVVDGYPTLLYNVIRHDTQNGDIYKSILNGTYPGSQWDKTNGIVTL